MGVYEDRLLPRIIDLALRGRPIERTRRVATTGLAGEVLEVGFGSGRNVPYYPADVTRVQAVDPATAGRQLAAARVAASPVPVEYVGLNGERLPLDDESIDHVLITWSLCTIPDVAAALGEVRRVLKPGGVLHFVEHGRSPDAKVARLQDRFTPIQRRVFGGCHLNRPIDSLVERSGLEIANLKNFYLAGPKFMGYMYAGTATRPQ
jgi:ubiquinone/menaquinone biosynthesis C-methylase UbiE